MKYLSDDEGNKEIVKSLYFESGVKEPKEFAKDIVQKAYEAQSLMVDASLTSERRQKIQTTALDHAFDIAVWKALTDRTSWNYFLAELKANKVTVRDIEAIKRIVEEQFQLMLEEALENNYIVIHNIKSFTVDYKRDGISLRILR